MPWHVVQDHADCPASKPWAVVMDATGEVEGCHATKDDAMDQMAAFYAQEGTMDARAKYQVVQGAPGCAEGKPWGVVGEDGKRLDACGCHETEAQAKTHMSAFYAGTASAPAPEPRYRPPAKRHALGTPIAGFKGQREVRTLRTIEFRAVDEVKRQALIRVCIYNEVDDYGTVWVPGCWQAGLEAKLPKGTWSHDWTDIIGRAIDYEDTDTELRLLCQFSDFAAVPRALQAWTQLRDGDVDEFSFGFDRRRWEIVDPEAATDGERERMIEAVMHEWSPVLVGAVPGTGTVSVRSPDPPVLDSEWVARLAVEMAAGKLSLLDALEAVREAAGGIPLESILPPSVETESDDPPLEDVQPSAAELDAQEALMAALDADVAEALKLAGRFGRRPRA